jgi:hypothetical protein
VFGVKRLLGTLCISVLLTFGGACGHDEPASTPTPAATDPVTGRIMGPAGDAQDTVDRLNQMQEQHEGNAP